MIYLYAELLTCPWNVFFTQFGQIELWKSYGDSSEDQWAIQDIEVEIEILMLNVEKWLRKKVEKKDGFFKYNIFSKGF